jgi:hypothetical protein
LAVAALFGRTRHDQASTQSPIGTFSMKRTRQPHHDTTKPPASGPATCARAAAMASTPSARPTLWRPNASPTSALALAMTPAAPTAWQTRKTSMALVLVATAQAAHAITKRPNPARKSRRRPHRSASLPKLRMQTVLTSM